MNLYLVINSKNTGGYGTYNGMVVAAPDEEIAKRIFPSWDPIECADLFILPKTENKFNYFKELDNDISKWEWVEDIADLNAKFIGTTNTYLEPTIVCCSHIGEL